VGYNLPAGYTPFLESVDKDIKTAGRDCKGDHLTPMRLPSALTTEDFTRAVAVATVSALRHQGSIISGSGRKERLVGGAEGLGLGVVKDVHVIGEEEEEGGGHEAPSWTRGVSAGVLLGCTLLYAIIAGKPSCHIPALYTPPMLVERCMLTERRNPSRRSGCCLGWLGNR
jgi:Ca2+:H+ antiporter